MHWQFAADNCLSTCWWCVQWSLQKILVLDFFLFFVLLIGDFVFVYNWVLKPRMLNSAFKWLQGILHPLDTSNGRRHALTAPKVLLFYYYSGLSFCNNHACQWHWWSEGWSTSSMRKGWGDWACLVWRREGSGGTSLWPSSTWSDIWTGGGTAVYEGG